MNLDFRFERVIRALLIIFTLFAILVKMNIDQAHRSNEIRILTDEIRSDLEKIDFSGQGDPEQLKKCSHELALLYKQCLFFAYLHVTPSDVRLLRDKNRKLIKSQNPNKDLILLLWEDLQAMNEKTNMGARHGSDGFIEELNRIK